MNIIDDSLQTPLHLAYLCGHTQMAQYLVQHGADVFAVDIDGCMPCKYVDGDSEIAENMQNRRKIYQMSAEWYYLMRLVNLGSDEEETTFLHLSSFHH